MLFNERATARVSVAGLAIAMLLAAMLLPGWILADDAPPAPADTDQTTPRAYLGILTDDSQPAPDSQTVVAPEVPGTPFAPPAPGKANTPTTQPLPATPQPPAPFDPPSTPAAAGLRISVPGMGPAPIALDLAFPVAHAPTDQSGAPGTAQAVETTAVQAVEAEGPDTELPAGDGHSTVRLKWLHNGLVRIEIVRDGQVVQQLHAAVPPATQNIPAAHPHVRHLRVAPLGDGRVLHFVPVEAAPGQPATRVAVVHAAPPVAAAPARVAMTLHGDQFTAAIPTADPQLQFECELAEITVEEKRIELEMATEQAAAQPSPDPTTRGKIKLLQLALRKAEIELARCRARMPQAQPLTPAAPTAVPAVPATPILPQPM